QQRLVLLHHGDVVGFLVRDQPVQVRPHGMEGVGGYHGAGQVQRFQELGEVAGLVVLGVRLGVVQGVPAVSRGAEAGDPGAGRGPPGPAGPGRWTGGPAGGGAPREVLPSTAMALNRFRASAFASCAARLARYLRTLAEDAPRRLPGRAPSRARARARGSSRSSTTRIVFSSGARYRPASGSHRARSR